MTAVVLVSVAALVVAVLALFATLSQRKALHVLAQRMNTLEKKLPEQLHEVKPVAPVTSQFSAHLNDAEKKQNNQEEYQSQRTGKPQVQADKYRYAVALAAQGQNVDSIAQALNMAPTEVEQVVQLARVKRPV